MQNKPEKKKKEKWSNKTKGINRNIYQDITYILSHINNQAKCRWFKHKEQVAELVRLDKKYS